MFEIVMGIDENEERAVAQAETVIDLPNAAEEVHVTIFHDFEENPSGASVHQVGAVRRAQELLEDAGVDVTLSEASGDPAQEIIELADERDANLITIAGRKRSPTGKALFGSVTQEVILNTDRSVLVCSAGEV